jgi:hypothetical protein
VLHDDRHIGFEYRRVIGVARYLLRVGKIIEPEVQGCDGRRPLRGRGRRIAVRKENRDRDVGVGIAGIQDAGGLVRDQRTVRK